MKQSLFTRASFSGRIVSVLLLFLFLFNVKAFSQGLPSAPKELIETAIENWNDIYGGMVKAISWSYEGLITNESKRKQVLNEITDPEKVWFPSGDINKPAQMTAFRIPDDPSVTNTDILAWQTMIRDMVRVGHHLVRLKWTKGTTSFTSICITDESTIIYDNMLSNVALMDHNSVCLDIRLCWIWQRKYDDCTRGEIKAELIIKCPGPICDHNCNAQMTLGNAKINCKVETIGNCCKLSWSYGWACGLKKLKLKAGKFEIDIEGILGSSGKGSGSCTECCPINTTSITNPVPVATLGGSLGVDGPQQIRTISVKTISGEVIDVRIPNNIRPGDHISGSLATKTSSTLEGAVIDINGQQHQIRDKKFTFLVPAGLAAIPFIIKNSKGESMEAAQIPTNVPAIPQPAGGIIIPLEQIERPPMHSPGNFAPMNYCQPGQPLTINGNFDGNAANTNISINNIPCEVIAESNRVSFINVPADLSAGETSLTIQEGAVTQTLRIQVVTIDLSANKTLVQKGTKAKVTVTVKGLENLDLNNNNFKIELTNGSPGVIQFNEANATTISRNINSSNAKNGTFTFTTDITGTTTGSYTVTSNLTSSTCTDCWKQYENCIASVEADEKQCYKDCDKNNGGVSCYLACSTAARAKEAECFAAYLGCVRKKLGY